ncbi:MAG: oligosaccharide flippase family protein, partial [Bryobacteraceae bacterium]
MEPAASAQAQSRHGLAFFINVLWSWLGVAVNLFVGLVLQPYIIRKLGVERYGIWALVFALLDYLWFFDLGFNTAVTNFTARYLAKGENDKINDVINTALFYFSAVSIAIAGLTFFLSTRVDRFFQVRPEHVGDFVQLIRVTGFSWAAFVLLHIFTSCLDGFQRFDLTSRAWVTTLVIRSIGSVLMLRAGYGLVEMGWVFVAAQAAGYFINFLSFRGAFPPLRLSPVHVKFSMIRQMANYGIHSFLGNAGNLLLNQSAPVLIGHFLPTSFVGFYSLPSRILQYAVDAVSRVALVTRSNAAELEATGRKDSVLWLGIYSNRYCFALFAPLTIFLLTYGTELIRLWISPEVAEHSAPLLPILAPVIALVMAGQYNSS